MATPGQPRQGRLRAVRARCDSSHQVSRTTLHQGEEHTITDTVSSPPDIQRRALCCFTGPKPHFSGAMAPENSINRLERALG
jgi:hypothetical protein